MSKDNVGQILMLKPEEVLADPSLNSRYALDNKRVKRLKDAIISEGRIIQNLVVEALEPPQGKAKYMLKIGFYRHAAASLANKDGAGVLLPCVLDDAATDAGTRLRTQLTENLERNDQSPMDTAVSIQQAIQAGITKADIRKIFKRPGKTEPVSNSWVNQMLQLLDLPKPVQKRIHEGDFTVGGAFELGNVYAKFPDKVTGVIERLEKERKALLEREEKDEQKFLDLEKRAVEAREKEQEAIKDKEAAELAKTKAVTDAELAKAEAARKLAEAAAGAATDPEVAAKVTEAAKEVKKADEKLTKLREKAKAAIEASKAKAKELETAKKSKSAAKPASAKKTATADVKKAASKEGATKNHVPLKAREIMEVVEAMCVAGNPVKRMAIGKALRDCFSGVTTDRQLDEAIDKIVK